MALSAVKVDKNTDYSKLRVKQLRRILAERGVGCKGCLEKGCDPEQLTEAVHVATAIRGGASLVHGMQMRDVADGLGM